MPAYRYFLETDFKQGLQVELKGQEQHHLAHVMRGQVGERVELVNGKGAFAEASIFRLGRREALLEIERVVQEASPVYSVILAQAIPRANRLDFILEKGTELGMTELWLFPAERSERFKFTEAQLERMQHVAIAAMKQCGSLFLPRIVVRDHFSRWEKFEGTVCFGDVDCKSPAKDFFAWKQQKRVLFFVGPEGGLTESEVRMLRQRGAQGLWLHDNILRTETAALAGLTLIHYHLKLSL